MDPKLAKQIVSWLAHELNGYIRECGSQYRIRITEDAIGEFVGHDASEAEQDEVRELCRKFLDGGHAQEIS